MMDGKDGEHPVGELYFNRVLYGEDMINMKDSLEEIGLKLEIDPIRDQATLFKIHSEEENDD